MTNTIESERYSTLLRQGVDLERDHVPAPTPHWVATIRTIQQGDDDWMIYEDGNESAQILVTEDIQNTICDLKEVR